MPESLVPALLNQADIVAGKINEIPHEFTDSQRSETLRRFQDTGNFAHAFYDAKPEDIIADALDELPTRREISVMALVYGTGLVTGFAIGIGFSLIGLERTIQHEMDMTEALVEITGTGFALLATFVSFQELRSLWKIVCRKRTYKQALGTITLLKMIETENTL